MYKNNFFGKWSTNLILTDTLDLVKRLFYQLDKNILLYSKLNETQKILIDDYQFITMNQFADNNFTVEGQKIVPIPKYDSEYDGEYFTYFEVIQVLPHHINVKTINNDTLNKFLIKECDCTSSNISNDKYDAILLRVQVIDNNNCLEEIQQLPNTLKNYYKALTSLNKGGDLYVNLNYYYHEPNIIFLQYILSFFDNVQYIDNILTANKIGYNMLKFNNYNNTDPIELEQILDQYTKVHNKNVPVTVVNVFYCTNNDDQKKEQIIKSLFKGQLDENFVAYLSKLYKQQNAHLKMLIKRVNFIDYKKIFRHINNQIDIAINWAQQHNVEVNDQYNKSKIIMKPNIIRKYFRSERGVDLFKIEMTNDSLYSISSPDVADQMSKLIKNALPSAKIIIDGTANVGGNTLSFSSYFDHVIAVEINLDTFNVLKNNVETYKRKNVELINDDFLNLVPVLSADVIFMDPPWTGTFYKMNDKMDLFLSEVNIIDIIPKLKCQVIALKLPSNYNIKGLLDKVNNLEIHKIYGILLIIIKNIV